LTICVIALSSVKAQETGASVDRRLKKDKSSKKNRKKKIPDPPTALPIALPV